MLTRAPLASREEREGVASLKIFAKGFNASERRLLQGIVLVSQRRKPPLQLLAEGEAEQADVVLIDQHDAEARAWADERPWLKERTVIWVDGSDGRVPGHLGIRRPVQWPALPMIVARAMEHNLDRGRAPAPAPVPPQQVPENRHSAAPERDVPSAPQATPVLTAR